MSFSTIIECNLYICTSFIDFEAYLTHSSYELFHSALLFKRHIIPEIVIITRCQSFGFVQY